jgi:hypothetical protein
MFPVVAPRDRSASTVSVLAGVHHELRITSAAACESSLHRRTNSFILRVAA